MNVSILVNGRPPTDRNHALAFDDRGLQYGDGLFETALLAGGRIRYLEEHLERLRTGCDCLGIVCPDRDLLIRDIGLLTAGRGDGILKIVVTRGAGVRTYRATSQAEATRIMALFPSPPSAEAPREGIEVRWCTMRLGRNPALAGIKHLNRLEQVLAQSEWNDPQIAEGLMLDTEGELVAATAGNLFLVRGGILCTSDLRYCGIRGVMRARVIAMAISVGIPVEEQPLWPADLDTADEVFITNAIRGIWPVLKLEGRRWRLGAITQRIAAALTLW